MAGAFRVLILATRIVWALALARMLLVVRSPAHAIPVLLGVRPRGHHPQSHTPARIIAFTDGIARRLPWRPTCLERALASGRLLAAADVSGHVVVGVTTGGANVLDAHAWIEGPGIPPSDRAHQPLTMWGFPRSAAP